MLRLLRVVLTPTLSFSEDERILYRQYTRPLISQFILKQQIEELYPIDLKKMSVRQLALLALALSLAIVASSFLWWAPYQGGDSSSLTGVQYHGFPISYYDTYFGLGFNYPQPANFIVDTLLFFIPIYGAFALYRRRT